MKRTALAVAGLALATLALAQLAKYKAWARSPEADFLTAQERGEWSRITTDADAEKFIAAYWAKRGGERFKEAIQRRIAAANEQFKMLRRTGAESSRGRIYIVLGSPTRRVESHSAEAGEGPETGSGSSAGRGGLLGENPFGANPGQTTETWVYEKDRFDPSWGIGELRASIVVDPQRGTDSVENADEVNRVLATVAEKSIVNPPSAAPSTATAVPSTTPAAAPAAAASAAAGPTSPPAGSAPAPAGAALPEAARASLSSILKEKKESSGFWGDVFRTDAGEPFYAMEFYFAGEKAPSPGAKFGGIVTDDSGSDVATFWEDATFSDRKTGPRSDKAYERSITLSPGSYRAAFGIFAADGAAPLESASVSFRLERNGSDFEVSPLILTNELKALTTRPAPTDPFVFGVEKPVRIAPKADRTFSQQDSLWYFYAVSNPRLLQVPAAAPTPVATASAGTPGPVASSPSIAEAKPRIMQRVGVLRDGKPAFAPFTGPAEMQLLSPGYYASGNEIPLATFEPGYYTLTLNVRDLNAPHDSPSSRGIDRQGDFIVLKPDGSMPEKAAAKPAPAPKPKPHPKK